MWFVYMCKWFGSGIFPVVLQLCDSRFIIVFLVDLKWFGLVVL